MFFVFHFLFFPAGSSPLYPHPYSLWFCSCPSHALFPTSLCPFIFSLLSLLPVPVRWLHLYQLLSFFMFHAPVLLIRLFFFFNSFYFGVSQRRILVTPLCGAYTRLDIKIVLQNVSRIDLICLKEHISFSEAYDQFYWKLLPSSRAISLGWKIPGCSNILLKLLKTDLIFLKWKVWDDSSCGHQYLSCSSSVVFYFVLFYSLDLFYWGHIALINFHINVVKLMFPLQTFLKLLIYLLKILSILKWIRIFRQEKAIKCFNNQYIYDFIWNENHINLNSYRNFKVRVTYIKVRGTK